MALAGPDDGFRITDSLYAFGKQGAQILADCRFDTTGPAVGHNALGIERAKVGARRDISCLEIQPEPERFNHAAANLVLDWIITKQSQVTGAAARCNAWGHRNHAALRAVLSQH